MKIQHGHGFDGTQSQISGDGYEWVITTDNAPKICQVSKGKGSVNYFVEDGNEGHFELDPDWVIGTGATKEEAMKNVKERVKERVEECSN